MGPSCRLLAFLLDDARVQGVRRSTSAGFPACRGPRATASHRHIRRFGRRLRTGVGRKSLRVPSDAVSEPPIRPLSGLPVVEIYAFKLRHQGSTILDRPETHRQGCTLYRHLGRQGQGDIRDVLGGPLLETGQLVWTADRQGVTVSKAHCFFFRHELIGRRSSVGSAFEGSISARPLAPLLPSQVVTPGNQRAGLILWLEVDGTDRRRFAAGGKTGTALAPQHQNLIEWRRLPNQVGR